MGQAEKLAPKGRRRRLLGEMVGPRRHMRFQALLGLAGQRDAAEAAEQQGGSGGK